MSCSCHPCHLLTQGMTYRDNICHPHGLHVVPKPPRSSSRSSPASEDDGNDVGSTGMTGEQDISLLRSYVIPKVIHIKSCENLQFSCHPQIISSKITTALLKIGAPHDQNNTQRIPIGSLKYTDMAH